MKRDRHLAGRIRKLAGLDRMAAEHIRKGLDLLPNDAAGNTKIPDVGPEVRDWLSRFESPPDVVILPCTGPGNRAEALLEALPETSKMLVIERDARNAAGLFLRCPVENLIKADRLRLASGEKPVLLNAYLLSILDIPKHPTIGLYDLPELPPEDREFYETTLLKVRDDMRTDIMILYTRLSRGMLWQYNNIRNLPVLISNPSVDALENLFRDKPALVVAAGPSLNNAIEHFKDIADRFVVISTGTALKPLRKAGIKPDLVLSVDASKKTLAQFETRCDDLFLVCSSMASPEVIQKFKGLFGGFIKVDPIGKWLNPSSNENSMIYAGGTVTATAIDLAVKMGCNPVICTGLDLCMAEDGTSHADHTMYHGRRKNMKKLIPVPGNYRQTVLTSKQFFVYRDIISAYVRSRPKTRFINANDDGARIEGMEPVPPSAIPGFAAQPFDGFTDIRERHESWTQPDIEPVCEKIEKVIEQLAEIRDGAVKAAMTANELIVIMRAPRDGDEKAVRRKLAALKRFDRKKLGLKEALLVLDMSLRWIYFEMGRTLEPPNERCSEAVAANIRSRKLYEQIAGSATWTGQLLAHVLEEIRSHRHPSGRADMHPGAFMADDCRLITAD